MLGYINLKIENYEEKKFRPNRRRYKGFKEG
jgi:hypothetical protein